MTGILFVCYGNICRSPMAEFVMKELTRKAGRRAEFRIESAATSPCNTGSGVYPPARRMLSKHGIDCAGKRARPMELADYGRFDWLIGMDTENIREMRRPGRQNPPSAGLYGASGGSGRPVVHGRF